MKYLIPNEYSQFIFNAIGLDIEQTANYFHSEYLNHKEHNPAFEKELGKTIIAFGKEFDNKIERQKQSMASIDEIIDEEGTHFKINFEDLSFPISDFFPGVHPLQNIFTHIDNNIIHTLLTAWENFTNMENENEDVIDKYNREFTKQREDTFDFISGVRGTPTNLENFPEKLIEFNEWAIKSLVEINDKHGIKACRVALYEIVSSLENENQILRDAILINDNEDHKYLLSHSRFIIGNLYEKIHEVFPQDIAWQLDNLDFATTVNEPLPAIIQTNSKDKLSHKQQILLLDKLGVFETPEIMNLNATQKGKLFSYLLNRDEKNTTDYIRNKGLDKKQVSMDKDFVKSDKNVKKVSEILKEIGLEK